MTITHFASPQQALSGVNENGPSLRHNNGQPSFGTFLRLLSCIENPRENSMPHATQDSRADYGAQHIEICRLFQADEPNWPLLCRQVDLALDDEGLPQKFRAEYELILALDTRRPASAAEEHIERARDVITDLIDMHRALEEDGVEGHERDDIRHAIASLNAAVATVEADLEDMPREE